MISLEYQNIKTVLAKDNVWNWSEEVFVIKNIISDLKGKYTAGTFYEKELLKTNQKEFRFKKAKKKKEDKLYIKGRWYNSSLTIG